MPVTTLLCVLLIDILWGLPPLLKYNFREDRNFCILFTALTGTQNNAWHIRGAQ